MAQATKKRNPGKSSEHIDRIDGAIEAAQDAVKDLRRDLSRGRREMVKDVEKTLKDARANLRRVRRTLIDDLEDVGQPISGRDGTKSAPRKRAGSSKSKAKAHA